MCEASYTTGCGSGDRWLDRGKQRGHRFEGVMRAVFSPVLLHSQALTLSRLFTACTRDDRAPQRTHTCVKDDHHDTFPLLAGDVLIEGSREC